MKKLFVLLTAFIAVSLAQEKPVDAKLIDNKFDALNQRLDQLAKTIDDVL